MNFFSKKCHEIFTALGGYTLLAIEGGLILTKGRVRSLLELDIERDSEQSSYSFGIKHVYNMKI
jgi:hypothetical protein